MRYLYPVLLLFTLFCGARIQAQCPGTLTVNIQSVTDAYCPDNGTVVLGGNGVGNPSVTFKVISGPSHAGIEQNSNIFNSLTGGTYQFAAICNSQIVYVNATVNNLYSQLSQNFTITESNVCTNYTAGGTLTVTGISGGRAPYSYSFLANPSANYDDALSVYTGSNTFTTPSWGAYQVRIKDACGAFVTKTINLQPTYGAATFGGANINFDYAACDSATIWFWMNDDSYSGVSLADYSKLRFRIFEKPGHACNHGKLIKDFELTGSDDQMIVIPRRDLYIEVTNPCGEVRTSCYDYPDNDSLVTRWQPIVKGCGTVPDPYTLTIKHQYNQFAKLPVQIKLFNHTTNTIIQTSTSWNNYNCCAYTGLSIANDYRIEITDACGKADTVVIIPPSGALGIEPVGSGTVVDKECTYQNGKTTVKLKLTGLVSFLDIAAVTISSGPDNIGQSATINQYDGLFHFHHLTPGAEYGFTISNGCITSTLSFTVPADPYRVVTFTVSPAVTQQCGGSGTVNAYITYTGWGTYRSELWSGNTLVANNNAGVYTNVAPGNYEIYAIAEQTWCDGRKADTIKAPVTVYTSGTPPSVSRKIGYVCESGMNPLTKGSAYIETSGFGPFRYDIKRTSPSPQASFSNLATNAPANYTINNLDAYAVYTLQITDNCGNSTLSEIAVGTLGTLLFQNAYQPCAESPYLLQAPVIPGVSYSWTKSSSPAAVISTTENLYFANFVPANDGKYTCSIAFPGGCMQRQMVADLSSLACGGLLPVSFIELNAGQKNCEILIDWLVVNDDAVKYLVERSIDGKNFTAIGIVQNSAATADSLQHYNFIDKNSGAGVIYYRIKSIYSDKYSYSKSIKILNKCSDAGFNVSVYPNPVVNNNVEALISSQENATVYISVINSYGQVVKSQIASIAKDKNIVKINLNGLAAGIYTLSVNNGTILKNSKFYKSK
jgi:Secretion system C-terminal sorting domain